MHLIWRLGDLMWEMTSGIKIEMTLSISLTFSTPLFHFWPPQQADGRSNGGSRECHGNALRTMREVGRGLKPKGIHPAPIRSTAAADLSEGKSHREWMHRGGGGSGGRNIGWTTMKKTAEKSNCQIPASAPEERTWIWKEGCLEVTGMISENQRKAV